MLGIALIHKNQIVQEEQYELDQSMWDEAWDDGLIRFDQPLRQLLSRFSGKSYPRVTVIYHSPSLNQQVYNFDLNKVDACEAGMAKLRESVGYHCAVDTSVLWSSQESTTVLAYAEKEEQLRSLYGWLNRCHLKAASFIPLNTAIMNTAAELAADTEEDTALFYLGSDVSVIAYSNNNELKVIRSAQIGYRTLVEGYAQAMGSVNQQENHNENEENSDSENQHQQMMESLKMLFEHGVPLQNTEVDGVNLRSTVLPVLAPVLQRMCIEIKQTFRFGLNGQSAPKGLLVCGPGAQIPFLSKSISQHLDLNIHVAHNADDYSTSSMIKPGLPEWDALNSENASPGLLPKAAKEELVRNKLGRLAIGGAACAAVILGAEYGMTTLQQSKLTRSIQAGAAQINAVRTFQNQAESVSQFSNLMTDVSHLVVDTVSQVPQWNTVLTQLDSIATESIHIEELRGGEINGEAQIGINGLAVSSSEGQATKELNQFVSKLEAIDGVSKVTLGATNRIAMGESQWGRQFELQIHLVNEQLPYTAFLPELTK